MPAAYVGDGTGVTARQAVSITQPVDGDAATAASNNAGEQELADLIDHLMQGAALLGGTTNAKVLRLEGLPGDTNPAAQTQTVPTHRKLVHELASHATVKTRIYSELLVTSYDDFSHFGGITVTTNAAWDGAAWNADLTSFPMTLLHAGVGGLRFHRINTGAATLTDAQLAGDSGGLSLRPEDDGTIPAGTILGSDGIRIKTMGITSFVHPGVRYVGDPGEPAFANAFSYLPGERRPGFWRDAFGVVHLTGRLVLGTNGMVAFTLPVGYRPAAQLKLTATSWTAGVVIEVLIVPGGAVSITSSSGTPECYLDGLNFYP